MSSTFQDQAATMRSLAAGAPMVCMPMGRDQNDTAARVVYRGAGVRLRPDAATEKIGEAIVDVLSNPKYRERERVGAANRGWRRRLASRSTLPAALPSATELYAVL
jgi:hypothetical protein